MVKGFLKKNVLFISPLPQKKTAIIFLKLYIKVKKNCIPIIQKFENISDIKFF